MSLLTKSTVEMDNKQPLLDRKIDGLTTFRTWVFGMGHLLNDLAGAIWFNYGLYYLTNIAHIPTIAAGWVILTGQIIDAAATPVIATLSDKFDSRVGKRIPWYIFGTVLVPACFFFVFQPCFACNFDDDNLLLVQVVWYCTFAGLENIGWAAVQIAHMALIPALTPVKEKKDKLVALRNAFTFIANILVLTLALILFWQLSDPQLQFTVLVAVLLSVGILTNILFCAVIRERELCSLADKSYKELGAMLLSPRNQIESSPQAGTRRLKSRTMTWRDWLRKEQLYWIGILYMVSRLVNNYTTGMIPFYLVHTIELSDDDNVTRSVTPWQLAVVSLVMYIASVSASFFHITLSNYLSRKSLFLLGICFILVAGVSMYFLDHDTRYAIIPIVLVLGLGFSLVLNCSTGMISAFVGRDAASGAFVWGIMGLLDKVSSGIAFFVAASLGDFNDGEYIRVATVSVVVGTAVLGVVSVYFIDHIKEYSEREIEVKRT